MMGVWLLCRIRKEVLSLGSKHSLSNGNESQELTDLVAGFEVINKCKITLTSSLVLTKGYLDLKWIATAHPSSEAASEQSSLALASASVWGGDYRTFLALLTRLLYAMDFQLALNEFDMVLPKKA